MCSVHTADRSIFHGGSISRSWKYRKGVLVRPDIKCKTSQRAEKQRLHSGRVERGSCMCQSAGTARNSSLQPDLSSRAAGSLASWSSSPVRLAAFL